MIYKLINPSDDYTFEAESDLVAAIVVCALGQSYGAERSGWSFGPFVFGGMFDTFREQFKSDPLEALDANLQEIAAACASVRIGNRSDYDGLDDAGIDALMDKRRTSFNRVGVQMRKSGLKILAEEAATGKDAQ